MFPRESRRSLRAIIIVNNWTNDAADRMFANNFPRMKIRRFNENISSVFWKSSRERGGDKTIKTNRAIEIFAIRCHGEVL